MSCTVRTPELSLQPSSQTNTPSGVLKLHCQDSCIITKTQFKDKSYPLQFKAQSHSMLLIATPPLSTRRRMSCALGIFKTSRSCHSCRQMLLQSCFTACHEITFGSSHLGYGLRSTCSSFNMGHLPVVSECTSCLSISTKATISTCSSSQFP